MKKIKIFSTADWHFCENNLQQFLKSIQFFIERAETERPDYITIAGDIFDRPIFNTAAAGFTIFIQKIRELLNIAPIITIYGTKTHDIPGSLRILREITAKHKFYILNPGIPLVFDNILFIGIPEISKEWIFIEENQADIGDAIGSFLNGIAWERSKRENLPCVLLYHGAVKGGKISETQTVPPGDIELSASDLQGIGAEYVSCGHYHMRQKIAENVYYEGSIFPVSWGETTQKAFSIVQIIDEAEKELFDDDIIKIIITDVDFPHPVRMKYIYDNQLESLPIVEFIEKNFHPANCSGMQLWLEIRGDKKGSGFDQDPEYLIHRLKVRGAEEGSRVTFKPTAIETVRAKGITEKKSLFEKLEIWAENSGVELAGDYENKCNILQNEIRSLGFSHDPRHMQLLYVSTKGSRGVWKGLRKKKIEIDFREYNPGTLAFIGDNGKGKSSIIRQCSPYPDPIEGGGKIADDYYLRDSENVQIWRDQNPKGPGTYYKIIKKINGKAGTAQFFIYSGPSLKKLEPVNSEITGRKDPFKKAVNEIFGSPELFKMSAYISQKDFGLPDSTKERKELFNELIGNNYLEKMTEIAKAKRKDLEKPLEFNEVHISTIIEQLKQWENLEDEAETVKRSLSLAREDLETLQEDKTEMKSRLEELEKKAAEDEKVKTEIDLLERTLQDIQRKIEEHSGKVLTFENAQKQLSERLEQIEKLKAESKKRSEISEELLNISNRRTELNDKFNKNRAGYFPEILELEKKQTALEGDVLRLREILDNFDESRKNTEELKTVLADPCEKCGHVKAENQEKIKILDSEIKQAEEARAENENLLSEKKKALAEIVNQLGILKKQDEEKTRDHGVALEAINKKLFELQTELEPLKGVTPDLIQEKEKELEESREADAVIKAAQEAIKDLTTEQAAKTGQLIDLQDKVDPEALTGLSHEKAALSDIEDNEKEVLSEVARLEERVSAYNKALEEKAQKQKDLELTRSEHKELKKDFSEYEILERALGRDGIQALELDAAAPQISGKANELLEGAFGPRYEIRFETLREVGTGSARHMAEAFDIFVTDSEETESELEDQSLSTLSGGQSRWILKALFDAFGIIREQNTGLRYLTAFQDEADGALSPEKKYLYLKMIERAHFESGRIHTIYITHDQGIQNVINQHIKIEELRELEGIK